MPGVSRHYFLLSQGQGQAPLSVWALGIILMSSAAPSNQKMCPPIPVPCQDVSLDMIDMSPANCHACHFKYF